MQIFKVIPKRSSSPDDPVPETDSKALWKFVVQTLISILTAILTALGASSCMHQLM